MADYNAQWWEKTDEQKRRIATRHYNGTCVCYTLPGMGLNRTRESGKHCLAAQLSGAAWDDMRRQQVRR